MSLLAKLAAAPVVAIAWLVAARLVISALGVDGYAIYAIIAGIAVLLPFTDLGMGAAVMDAMARRNQPGVDPVESVLLTTWRGLGLVGLILTATAVVIAIAGWWAPILGVPADDSVEISVALALTTFALGLPLSVGPRLLIGGGLNHWAVMFQALSAFLMLVCIAVATLSTTNMGAYVVAPFVSAAMANSLALVFGARRLKVAILPIARSIFAFNSRGAKVRHVAGPMFVISVVLPLAFQTDRIILSHVATLKDVAAYSVAFQIFSPLLGLIGSAAIALWPVFVRAQASLEGLTWTRFVRCQMVFGALGFGLCVAFVLLTPYLAEVVSAGKVEVSWALVLAFGILLLIQALSHPLGMVLTTAPGLRFQAQLHVLALAFNLPLSILLATRWGASGPVVASILAMTCIQLAPLLMRVRNVTVRS